MKEEYRRLFDACMSDMAMSMGRALGAGRDALRQRLSDRATAEASADVRHVYNALLGRLDAQWPSVIDAFTEGFGDFVANRQRNSRPAGAEELRLVDDDIVEWEIALGGYMQRMASAGGAELANLEQRFAVLNGGEPDDRAGDYGMAVCAAGAGMRRAIEAVAGSLTERRILLPGLTALLSEALGPAVEQTNDTLAARGIEYGMIKKRPRNEKAGQDILSAIEKMVQGQGGGAGQGAGGGGPGGNLPAGMGFVALPAAAIDALNRLQDLDKLVLASGDESKAPVGGSALREFRQREGHNLPPMEAATIDVVATVFDLIFEDAEVPDAIKALIGRLQIPMLKVAMNDKTFFSDNKHPARALLDAISRAAVAVGRDLDRDHPFYLKVRDLVNAILEGFEKDPEIFTRLLPDVQAVLAAQEAAAAALAERSRKVSERQEATDLAEIKAEEIFEQVLKEGMGDDVPSLVVEFLSRHWPPVFKSALLNGGPSGAQWGIALQTLVDLLWSLQPKVDPEERQRMLTMLPGLLRRIGGCLDMGQVAVADRTPFLDALVQLHSAALKGLRKQTLRGAKHATKEAPPAPKSVDTERKDVPTTVVTRVFQEDGIEVEAISVDGRLKAAYPVRIADLENIQRGDWVEFDGVSGGSIRARLSWISPHRGIMLFSNPDASRAVSITPEALALKFKQGKARIVGEEPLVERVLSKALDAMQPA